LHAGCYSAVVLPRNLSDDSGRLAARELAAHVRVRSRTRSNATHTVRELPDAAVRQSALPPDNLTTYGAQRRAIGITGARPQYPRQCTVVRIKYKGPSWANGLDTRYAPRAGGRSHVLIIRRLHWGSTASGSPQTSIRHSSRRWRIRRKVRASIFSILESILSSFEKNGKSTSGCQM